MKNNILRLSSIVAAVLVLLSCGKKANKNEQKDTVKKDTAKKTEAPKKQENSIASKLGVNIPKGTYTYYGKQKDGYMLLAIELDNQTYKRKAMWFKDVSDKDLQPCDIVSDKEGNNGSSVVIKTKETQKEIKIAFPIMGDILANGKKLAPASIFMSDDNRILTSSGGPIFMPFLLGENMNDLNEITISTPHSKDVKKEDGTYMVYPGRYKGKKVEVLVPSSNDKFDKLILTEDGKDVVFKNIQP